MRFGFFIVVSWASLCAAAGAAELGAPIDLSGLAEIESPVLSEDDSLPLQEVAFASETAVRRFYVSGIIGDSEQTFSDTGHFAITDSVLTAGGAAGVSFDRTAGALRLEIEGRGRGNVAYAPVDIFAKQFTDNWSVLVNAWRDFEITERFGLYAGGGLGAGGFRYSSQISGIVPPSTGSAAVTTFAWQGGGGVIYELSDRVTLDLGYRFYCMQNSPWLTLSDASGRAWFFWPPTMLSASEFLLSVRVYEPFRRWR